eukprot:7199662-Pyramimonas_sp.AAC.1
MRRQTRAPRALESCASLVDAPRQGAPEPRASDTWRSSAWAQQKMMTPNPGMSSSPLGRHP